MAVCKRMLPARVKYALVVAAMLILCAATLGQSPSGTFTQMSANCSPGVPPADGHRIYLLLMNGKSGKPVKNVWVFLRGAGPNTWPQSVRSNSQGIAEFVLRDPIPDRIGFSFEANEFWSCSVAEFGTNEILTSGVVAQNICAVGRVYASHPSVSGQIVVYGSRVTAWQKIGQAIPFLTLFR